MGAAKYGVRLRPSGGDEGVMDNFGHEANKMTMNREAVEADFLTMSANTSNSTPLSVFQSIYTVLQDDHTGLFQLALAMLRPKLTKIEENILRKALVLPPIAGLDDEVARTALVELWLWQAMRKHAIKLQSSFENIEGAKGSSGIRKWNGRFSQVIIRQLGERGLKASGIK